MQSSVVTRGWSLNRGSAFSSRVWLSTILLSHGVLVVGAIIKMVCQTCNDMLRNHKGIIPIGPGLHLSELGFEHHATDKQLQSSATGRDGGCHLCHAIWIRTRALSGKILAGTKVNGVPRFLSATLKGCILARSDLYRGQPQLYRLDFHVEGVEEVVASFILEQTG